MSLPEWLNGDDRDGDVPFSAAEILERCDILATHSSRIGAIERSYLTSEHARTNWTVGEWMAQAGLEP